jgi:hypothetical protein
MADHYLLVSPSDLAFQFEPGIELQSVLCIRNVHQHRRVGFKVKTTNPDRYMVTPSAGIVEPDTKRIIKVFLQEQEAWTEELV